jgi:adenosylhomocysteine nucleosidase
MNTCATGAATLEPPVRPIGIVAALDEELSAFLKRMRLVRQTDDGRMRFIEGTLGGRCLVVVRTGEGRDNAESGTARLLQRHRVSLLIGIGFCGAISPGVAAGTVLVGQRMIDGEDPASPVLTPTAPRAITEDFPGATFLTLDRMLCTAEGKQDLWRKRGENGATAVDMESAAVGRVAESREVPYVAVRAVSDLADETLPLDFNQFVDDTGRINRLEVAAHAARHPTVIRSLWKLRARARSCSDALARAVGGMIERGTA